MSIFVMYMATARVVYVVAGVGLFAAGRPGRYIAARPGPLPVWDPGRTRDDRLPVLQSLFTIADGGIIGAASAAGTVSPTASR
jgi:hypothetical protein